MLGLAKQLMLWRHLDQRAQIHHRDEIAHMGHDRKVMADEQEGQSHLALKLISEVQDIGLDRDIERRHAFVGHDESGLLTSARAMEMRCRCPPENACGKRRRCSRLSRQRAAISRTRSFGSARLLVRAHHLSGSAMISRTVMRGLSAA
jgi:hypothetical protein